MFSNNIIFVTVENELNREIRWRLAADMVASKKMPGECCAKSE